jgi:2-polyprenyl-6-methoxyphenol hydroxylase-like FAD-dependent oxidoreductase
VTRPDYDVIVVGARCAGSPTAMLLARRGYKVLVVDRSTFPSDTLSTHVVHPLGVAALRRWGVLDRLVATGCPAIDTYVFDFGPFAIEGAPGTAEAPVAYCPRRTVLDKILVDAAVDAGAEIREAFVVDEIVRAGDRVTGIRGHHKDGPPTTITARVVIGADGRSSVVARSVGAADYHARPPLLCGYYSYWRGLPMRGRFETYIRDRRGFAAAETHDGLTMVVAGWPYAEFEAQKRDLDASYERVFDTAPDFAARIRAAERVDRVYGAVTPNAFRTPFGPGWALVGDAGYIKDPITAQGIADAFRDAELVTGALDASFSGARPYDAAMAAYQEARDAQSMPMFELTCQLATLEPPPPELQQLLGSIHGNRDAMDDFCRMNAGTISPAAFFSRR